MVLISAVFFRQNGSHGWYRSCCGLGGEGNPYGIPVLDQEDCSQHRYKGRIFWPIPGGGDSPITAWSKAFFNAIQFTTMTLIIMIYIMTFIWLIWVCLTIELVPPPKKHGFEHNDGMIHSIMGWNDQLHINPSWILKMTIYTISSRGWNGDQLVGDIDHLAIQDWLVLRSLKVELPMLVKQ